MNLLLSLTVTTDKLNSPRQGWATTYPRLSLTPTLLATFSSPFLLSLELLKEVEGEGHNCDLLFAVFTFRVGEPDFLLKCFAFLLTNKATSFACYFSPSSKRLKEYTRTKVLITKSP